MSNDRPAYSRIYWSVMDDDKFDGIREDVRLFGAWSLLLIVADMAYPSPAFLPPTVSRSILNRLQEAELVDILPGHRYRIHGLAAERERRSGSARVGGLASARSRLGGTVAEQTSNERSTDAEQTANIGRGRDEDETSRGTDTARATDPADVYWTLTGRYPTDKVLGWLDDLSLSYGPEAVVRAVATAHAQDRNASTLLGRSQDLLRSEARALSLKEQASVRAKLKERRAAPVEAVDQEAIRAEIRRLMEPGAAA